MIAALRNLARTAFLGGLVLTSAASKANAQKSGGRWQWAEVHRGTVTVLNPTTGAMKTFGNCAASGVVCQYA